MLKYSTDKSLFRQAQTDTSRWKPSRTSMELREPVVILAERIIKPKYDTTRIILRKAK